MKNKLYFILAIAATLATSYAVGASAANESIVTPSLLKLERINVTHSDSLLTLSFDLKPSRVKPGRDRQVIFTPIIRSLDVGMKDSIEMDPITVAGRNRYFTYLREGQIAVGDPIYKAGDKGIILYERSVEWQSWMYNSEVFMREEVQDCCRPIKPLCDTPIATIDKLDNITNGIEDIEYIALTGDSAVEFEVQGSAYIDFKVNRTEIHENYRKNPEELKKIIESINVIKNDPDAIITRLSIKGFASPEGSYDNNVRLAMGRTESLKEYVRKKYDFNPEILYTNYEPEDWDGLRSWLEHSTIPNREKILAIANSDLLPDPKNEAIQQQFPEQYKLMLDSVYPGLRHSDYNIRYKIKTYIDMEELKRVYKDAPERLRPIDFYRIAENYDQGSEDYDKALLLASEIYPHDQEAAINAANILLRRGDVKGASEKLNYAGESGEANFTRGNLALINQDLERAQFFFKKALEQGKKKAASKLITIENLKHPEIILYQIDAPTQ